MAAAVLVCVPPAASAAPWLAASAQDLRSPDTRDAPQRHLSQAVDRPTEGQTFPGLAREATKPPPTAQVLRPSDSRDAAARIAGRQDLRSPDTRDIAAGRKFPPTATVITVDKVRPTEPNPASGFDWTASVIGAAAGFGAVLLMSAAALIVIRRRASHDQPVGAA